MAVIAVPDDRWGERPRAYVLARGDVPTPQELQQHVRARLAAFKVPDHIVFVDELPRTATGKVQKFQLRAAAATAS